MYIVNNTLRKLWLFIIIWYARNILVQAQTGTTPTTWYEYYDDTTTEMATATITSGPTETVTVPPTTTGATPPEYSTWSTMESSPTGSEPTTLADGDYDTDDENFDETLTPEAYIHLTNLTGENITEAQIREYNKLINNYISWEWTKDIRHFADFTSYMRTCYHLATTYKNAMRDLRKYYQIRFLYVDTKEYEIGYVTQEIVHKYQIVLELFHLIQRKYYQNRLRQYAPTTYMLYMYTNILHQCMDIIHLCNMLHEIEKKYRKDPSKGIWFSPDEVKGASNKTYVDKMNAIRAYEKRLQRQERKKARERKKRMKELEKGKLFRTTRYTTRRTKLYWDLHYGWSIEYW